MNLRPTSIARQKIPFQPRFWLWDSGTLSCLLLLLDCFPYTRHPLTVKDSCRPWFSQTPGFCWAGAGTPGLFKNIVLVIGSLRSVWIRLFARDCGGVCSLGFPTPNREAECRVRKGVGLWTNFWAVVTPVPDSLSHPIPSIPDLRHSEFTEVRVLSWEKNSTLLWTRHDPIARAIL